MRATKSDRYELTAKHYLAANLIIERKHSYREIAKLVGVAKTTLVDRKSGWPSHPEFLELIESLGRECQLRAQARARAYGDKAIETLIEIAESERVSETHTDKMTVKGPETIEMRKGDCTPQLAALREIRAWAEGEHGLPQVSVSIDNSRTDIQVPPEDALRFSTGDE